MPLAITQEQREVSPLKSNLKSKNNSKLKQRIEEALKAGDSSKELEFLASE
jgi:hypothetical protein